MIAILGPIVSGCMHEETENGTTAIANPASEYCIEIRGQLEIREEAGGQTGYCHLPDGTTVEEWTLFRESQE